MAAGYSKACPHERPERSTLGDAVYCRDCGENITLLHAIEKDRLTAPSPVPIDTSELGPIKLDYATAVGDAKALNWRRIPHGASLPMPLDKAWFAAWREMPWGGEQAVWKVERVPVGGKCPALAVWWSDDVLGVPPCND